MNKELHKMLSSKWVECLVTEDGVDISKICGWYLDRVVDLLLILKHDLQLIVENGVVADSPLYKCPEYYRGIGVCALFDLASDWTKMPESCTRELNNVRNSLHTKFKVLWYERDMDPLYPVDIGSPVAVSTKFQFRCFMDAVRPGWLGTREVWEYAQQYAAARIALIDQVIIDIEDFRKPQVTASWSGV